MSFAGNFFNRNYYSLIRLILVSAWKQKGKTTFNGWTITYDNARALIGMYNEIIFQEHYKFNTESKQPIIIDCGSNIGISVLYFDRLVKNARIIAVEADPMIADILRKNLSMNSVRAEVIEKAIWKTSGEQLSFGSKGSDEGSLYSKENTIFVESIRLKDLMNEYEHIDLLKIDIEGAEVEVLKDAEDSLSRVHKLFVEYHSYPDKQQELDVLLAIVTRQGFRYTILQARKVIHPFLDATKKHVMDLQLNIFCYRP
jgi:FkbM family methyltransferase